MSGNIVIDGVSPCHCVTAGKTKHVVLVLTPIFGALAGGGGSRGVGHTESVTCR